MAWHGLEILPAELQRAMQIGNTDACGSPALPRLPLCTDICDIALIWSALILALPWSLSPFGQRPQSCATRRAQMRRSRKRSRSDQTRAGNRTGHVANCWHQRTPNSGPIASHASVIVALASRSCLGVKLHRDPGRVLPVTNSATNLTRHLQVHWERTMSIFGKIMGAIFGSKARRGAGRRAALQAAQLRRHRRGARRNRRCRSHPRQGGRGQEGEARLAAPRSST